MKLAIMQPYVFPYLGYFQLIESVDRFVFYDDVDYIKGGWINRNKVLLNGKESIFTIPLENASSNKKINKTNINLSHYDKWQSKFMRSIDQSYSKAPYYEPVRNLIIKVLSNGTATISEMAKSSIIEVLSYLNIAIEIVHSSSLYENEHLRSQERVLDICRQEQAKVYTNAIGGRELYEGRDFAEKGVSLNFIKPSFTSYSQLKAKEFVPALSIIDVLMMNSVEDVKVMFKNFELLTV